MSVDFAKSSLQKGYLRARSSFLANCIEGCWAGVSVFKPDRRSEATHREKTCLLWRSIMLCRIIQIGRFASGFHGLWHSPIRSVY